MVFGSLRIIMVWLAGSTQYWNEDCSPCSSELICRQILADKKMINVLTPRHLLFTRTLLEMFMYNRKLLTLDFLDLETPIKL